MTREERVFNWFNGVKNTDVGLNFKLSGVRGKIIAIDKDGIYCTLKNKNGKIHTQLRSNVMVSRPV